MTSNQPDLDHLAALDAAATPGPWHLTDSSAIVAPLTGDEIADVWEPTAASRNGEFIEAARTAVPALVVEVRRLRAELAAAGRRDITSPLAVIVKHGEMSETVRQEISDLLAAAEEPAVESHVVADDSDDPEHIDDCPGCEAFTLTGHRAAPAARSAAV